MLPSRVEVLIVGFGPVGAALAALLGRYGVPTLVIDKAHEIVMAPRAIALDNEALRILQLIGLGDDAFAKTVIPEVRMHCPYVGHFATISMAGTVDDHPKLVTFYQPDLERALRAQVGAQPSVSVALGSELLGFVEEHGEVRASLRTADGEHEVRARYIVGADGASSKVRAIMGQAFVGQSYVEDWLIVDATGVPGSFDHVEFHCDPRRPTPHMIAPGGRRRWEFMLMPGEDRAVMERAEVVRELLAPWTQGHPVTIERQAVYRFHARSCARYSDGRAFLVGDAAHITPPFAGQGLVAGLRDVANLAWKLAWVVQGRAHPSILDSYDRERRPHAVKMIALATRMGRVIVPRTRAGAVAVHGAMRMARSLPWVGPLLERGEIKPKPVFERGLFVAGRGRLRRGSMLPQMLVTTPAGGAIRSDELLGPSLALITYGDAPPQLAEATRQRWHVHGGTLATLPGGHARGWCAVVRPDRTVLHDGPPAHADAIVNTALDLLAGRRPMA